MQTWWNQQKNSKQSSEMQRSLGTPEKIAQLNTSKNQGGTTNNQPTKKAVELTQEFNNLDTN